MELTRFEITQEMMNTITAGAGNRYRIPSKPIADLIGKIVCGGHNMVFTGREIEEDYFIFWSRHMKQYKCTKCGHVEWRHED